MNWEKDLFTNVPRADTNSELAKQVSKQWGGTFHLRGELDPNPTKFVVAPEKTQEAHQTEETDKETIETEKTKKSPKKNTKKTLKKSESIEDAAETVVTPDKPLPAEKIEKPEPADVRPALDNPFSVPITYEEAPKDETTLEVGGTFVLD
jgi:hypothetical protein